MAMVPVTAAAAGEEREGPRVAVAAPGLEIAFFDLETSMQQKARQGYTLLEFGVILVCPRRLIEVTCYGTLVRPADLDIISFATVRCNGITRDAIATAPPFLAVYYILHERVWAGHNILRFDLPRIREAFNEPKGTIDTFPLLTQRFVRRAGDMKMWCSSLYKNYGLKFGETHSS